MQTAADLDVRGQRVLVRSDLNVPLDGTTITDDGRIRASLPLLQDLLGRGARVVLTLPAVQAHDVALGHALYVGAALATSQGDYAEAGRMLERCLLLRRQDSE